MKTINLMSILCSVFLLAACSSAPTNTHSETNASPVFSIPDNCIAWFDGCNTCTVTNKQLNGCTRKFCSERDIQPAKCIQYESHEIATVIPSDCKVWFDGCNRCNVNDGEINSCTEMACSDEAKSTPQCLEFNIN